MPDTPELPVEAPGNILEAISELVTRAGRLEDALGTIAGGLKRFRPSGTVPGLYRYAPPRGGTVPDAPVHEHTPDSMLIRAALKALDVPDGQPVPAHRAELARTYLATALEERMDGEVP